MAVPTPILGLKQYDATEDMDYVEVNAQFAQLDTLPPTVCTSSTRPGSNLYQGRMIYETDTKAILMWDNTGTPGWRYIKPGNYKNYTHNWSGPTTLSIGAASLVARYRQIDDHVDFSFVMVRAADTNVGAAQYTWDLPVAMGSFQDTVGNGYYATAAGVITPCYIFAINSTTMVLCRVSDGVRVSNSTIAWATNDKIAFRGSYRAAVSV